MTQPFDRTNLTQGIAAFPSLECALDRGAAEASAPPAFPRRYIAAPKEARQSPETMMKIIMAACQGAQGGAKP